MNFWDDYASDYGVLSLPDEDWQRVHDYQLDLLRERLPSRGGRVLELGGGVGRLLIPLAEENRDVEFWNYDSSPGMLAEFTSRAADLKNVRATDSLSLRTQFDLIYCVLVIQHNDPDGLKKLALAMVEMLKPRGRILLQFVRGEEFAAHGPRSFDYKKEQISELLPVDVFFKDESGYADSWWWAEVDRQILS